MKKTILAICTIATLLSCSSSPKLYDWEKGRDTLPTFADMTLCYGGSAHRRPYLWNKERMAAHVSYTDESGKEQWLFDSFLALEFVDTERNKSYSFGYKAPSADKESWQALIDYWFAPDNGFDALDQAVADVIGRIGEPSTKRLVVMNLPDPNMYQMFNDSTTTSIYWGSLEDGRELDFRKGEDRVEALKWYVDEVRSRWNEAAYANIELLGFYIISEDLAIPGDGWSSELKHYEDIFPAISDYIHACNEGLYWIPYYAAAPYTKWKDFGIDMAIMQPNYFWGRHADYTMEKFVEMITASGMGMELEFDVLLEGSSEEAMRYKERFREYLKTARESGVYGTKPFALYSDTDALYDLVHSDDPSDKEVLRELCEFLIENPLKK